MGPIEPTGVFPPDQDELVRVIAAEGKWEIDAQSRVVDADGRVVAPSFSQLVEAMRKLGWIRLLSRVPDINWHKTPKLVADRVEALRQTQGI